MSAVRGIAGPAVAADAEWLAHRYDATRDAVQFRRVTRAEHAAITFITDDLIPPGETAVLSRADALAAAPPPAPIHFVFHSAFCCSTLLARAFDLPGAAMGLKEPVILNDLVGWRRRGARGAEVARALDGALALLARPFAPGEAVVVKPSNVFTGLIDVTMTMRPQARALLLHAPLDVYLASIARKGMWGRLWVRELIEGLLTDGLVDLGFERGAILRQTDLQVAATGWLAQQTLFDRLARKYGPSRIATLDSETLTARPAETMAALSRLYAIPLDAAAVAAGPAFNSHSKSGERFAAADRAAERIDGAALHADELEKVAVWARAVAESAGVPMTLPLPLIE